jgi:hypothetical protein
MLGNPRQYVWPCIDKDNYMDTLEQASGANHRFIAVDLASARSTLQDKRYPGVIINAAGLTKREQMNKYICLACDEAFLPFTARILVLPIRIPIIQPKLLVYCILDSYIKFHEHLNQLLR